MAFALIDGRVVDDQEACISIFDHGLVCGDGAFETIAVLRGKVFALRRHLNRLAKTARGLGLADPPLEELAKGVSKLVQLNGFEMAKIRITYTGGQSELGSARLGNPTRTIVAMAPIDYEPEVTAVVTFPWPRNEKSALAGLKTTSYAENVLALAWAKERGASEVLFANTVENLCEGSGSNVFVVMDGELITPPLSAGCLAGVTRDLIVEGFGAKEVDIPIQALDSGDVSEVFITSTLRMVQGVYKVDDRVFADAPGPTTLAVRDFFTKLIEANDEP
jgi:branched-chain amino acid aminotransferase